MPRPRIDTVQIVLRVPRNWLMVADEVANHLSRPEAGVIASRTDAFRVAIGRGFYHMIEGPPADAEEVRLFASPDFDERDAEHVRELLKNSPRGQAKRSKQPKRKK